MHGLNIMSNYLASCLMFIYCLIFDTAATAAKGLHWTTKTKVGSIACDGQKCIQLLHYFSDNDTDLFNDWNLLCTIPCTIAAIFLAKKVSGFVHTKSVLQ